MAELDEQDVPVNEENAEEGEGNADETAGDEGAADATADEPPPEAAPANAADNPEAEKEQREYQMYLQMAKSLTLQLPFERDRVIASKWVKKIETNEGGELKQRLNSLKLLCVSMYSHTLAGPFRHIPKEDADELTTIGKMTTDDIIKDMVQEKEVLGRTSPYFVEISGDLKEYAAYQEIPDFGAHFYYASSTETILNWANDKRAIVPAGTISYPMLEPPLKTITKSKEAFKKLYEGYAKPEAKSRITLQMLPDMLPELYKRRVLTKEEIAKMGTRRMVAPPCPPCPPPCGPSNREASRNNVCGATPHRSLAYQALAPPMCPSRTSTPRHNIC